MKYLKSILDKSKYSCELIHHKVPLKSAQEGAEYFNIDIGQTAPTLIIKTELGFFSLVISGNCGRVDFKEVGKILNCREVKLAKAKEIEDLGYKIGNVPLVGIPLPYILDEKLFDYSFVYGGSGVEGYTLKISPYALEELNQVIAKLPDFQT